jgi:hypothetical protein
MDVTKVVQDVAYIVSVCLKRFICFGRMLQAFLSGYCICFTSMLQEFIWNVSTVSVLCWNKCFHNAIYNCFIWMLHMFYTHVAIVCFKCFICFSRMLHQVFHVSEHQVFHVLELESPRGHGLGARRWGAASHGPAVRARCAPRILRTSHARPHAGSRVPRGLFYGHPWRRWHGCPDTCFCSNVWVLVSLIFIWSVFECFSYHC